MSGHIGMNLINRQALDSLSSSFGQFVSDGHLKDSTIVKKATGLNALRAGTGDFRGNVIFRSASQIEENNAVRNAFLKSVSDVYGDEAHIPESVRKAMKLSDFDGKGHPLTARRIRATMDAIRIDVDHKKIADAVEAQEWYGEKFIAKQTIKNPALVDSIHQYADQLADDMLDIMKATILPDIEKGKAPSVPTLLRFLNLLAQEDKPETQNLFKPTQLPPDEIQGMNQICRIAAFAKALVRNEATIKFLFSNGKQPAAMKRNLDLALAEFEKIENKKRLEAAAELGAPKGGDLVTMNQVSCCRSLQHIRAFMLAGMSPDDIFSLLVKMADEQASSSTEDDKGNLSLAFILQTLDYLPEAGQREVSQRFLRHLGQSVLDGTLRPRKPGANDALYLDGLVHLSNMISECEAKREKNEKAGNHDLQPETIMGSAEVDAKLKTILREIRAETQRIRLAARKEFGSALLAACAAGLLWGTAEAKVLVYEGFDATDYSLNATSHDTLSSKSLTTQTAAIGTTTTSWGAMGGSQVKAFGTDYGLDFPQDMKDIGFTARGGSVGLNWKEGNASQLRSMYHTLATDVLKVSSGKLYFRELLAIQENCAARLYQKDSLMTGDGSHYGFGFTTGPSGNDYNLLLNGKSAMGFFFWKNKSNQIVLSFAVVDKDSQRTIVDLITGVALDTTYVCYAEIDVNASEGKEAIRANAVAVSDYSTTLTWKSVGEVDFITETTYPTCMAVAGPYQSKNGLFRADEIIVATELGEVIAANANAPVLEGATLLWNDATGACDVTAMMKKNSASFVASAKTSDSDASPVVSEASSVIGPGESDTVALSGFAADTTYRVWAIAGEGDDSDTKIAGSLYSGTLALAKVRDANEYGCVAGQVRVSRAHADPYPLVVNYAFSSTAEGAVEGQTWEVPAGSVTIPSGETSAIIELVPRVDMTVTEDIAVTLALTAGGYPSVTQTVDLTLANLTTRAEYNTWVAPEAGSAAVDANWSYGHAPLPTEDVLFDGYISSANCTWDADATHTVKSWTQNNGYAGIIELKTVYPEKGDFTVMTVTEAMTIDAGTLTHPLSRQTWDNISDYLADLQANETYRIRLDVGALTVGASGRIDATNKGYYQANSGSVTTPKASHGGWFGGSGLKPYDDVKEPIHIGLGDKPASGTYTIAIGGGAIYIVSTGDAVVDGTIRADTGSDCWNSGRTLRGAAAAGSVYLKANSVTGSGTISASAGWTDEQNNKGCGGRVAVIATSSTPVDFTTLKLKATVEPFKSNGTSECDTHGSAGTVFVKDASQTYGTLLIDNVANMPAQAFARPATIPCNDEGDWTFDHIGLGRRAILSVPEGTTLTLANGLDGVFAIEGDATSLYGVLRYDGGTLNIGSKTTQTMDGKWTFAPRTPYTVNGNLVLVNGARLGVQDLPAIYDQTDTLPEYGICTATVTGNLTVDANSKITVRGAGVRKEGNTENNGFKGVLPGSTHGGRSSANAWIDKNPDPVNRFMVSYDSVFAPHLPGCSVPHPNGQGCATSGGVLKLTVGGRLTNDGDICADGNDEGRTANSNSAGGTGGAIDITAGSIAGAGRIRADGGYISNWRGTGGRVAVKLTQKGADFAAYTGVISASGRSDTSAQNPSTRDGSAGSVYLETANEGAKHGTLRIAMTQANWSVNNANWTDIVSEGIPGSAVATGDDVADYKKVKLEVADYGRALVNVANLQLGSVALATTDAKLDLAGHALKVAKMTAVTGEGATIKVRSGTYTAAQLAQQGLAVIDSSADESGANATGTVEVTGGGIVIIVR